MAVGEGSAILRNVRRFHRAAVPDTPHPPASPHRALAASAYALVADADQRRGLLYREVLESSGLPVTVTRNGDEARVLLRRRSLPALVVANLSLPRLDGFALLAELRRIAPVSAPPVLVISSSKEMSGAAWNLKERLGVTELLPADAGEEAIRETLGRLVPALRTSAVGRHDPGEAVPAPRQQRWVAELLDRVLADVVHRFSSTLAVVSISLHGHEWFRVHVHAPAHPLTGRVSPRSWSYIRQVIEGGEPLVVPDVLQHPLFAHDVFPPMGTLRGYVGVPIRTTGQAVDGALCLFDLEPLTLDARAMDALSETAHRLAIELEAGLERLRSQERFSTLSRLALTDPLTGLANRRGGEEALAREMARARRSGAPLSLALFDIDRFKAINDRAGHAVGDRVLRGISEILSASQRGSDLATRWGGEEFLVLLPDVGLAGARAFAERVRANVQGLVVPEAGPITVSAGVSEVQPGEEADAALARADTNLYRAKAAGRNCVASDEAAHDLAPPPWLRASE
jgi:diguanylate cyclase (GGDEF)-like protein